MDAHFVQLIQRGKTLSYLFRHDKSYASDEHGWREVNDLVANHGFTVEELREIVANNNKQRYEFSENTTRIRARQGQSLREIHHETGHPERQAIKHIIYGKPNNIFLV